MPKGFRKVDPLSKQQQKKSTDGATLIDGVAYLTTAQVAKRFDVDPSTVLRWISNGLLPAFKPNSRFTLIREADALVFVPPLPGNPALKKDKESA